MKPNVKQAYDILVQATGMLRGTREEHFKLQEALKIIEQELTPKAEEKQV